MGRQTKHGAKARSGAKGTAHNRHSPKHSQLDSGVADEKRSQSSTANGHSPKHQQLDSLVDGHQAIQVGNRHQLMPLLSHTLGLPSQQQQQMVLHVTLALNLGAEPDFGELCTVEMNRDVLGSLHNSHEARLTRVRLTILYFSIAVESLCICVSMVI